MYRFDTTQEDPSGASGGIPLYMVRATSEPPVVEQRRHLLACRAENFQDHALRCGKRKIYVRDRIKGIGIFGQIPRGSFCPTSST